MSYSIPLMLLTLGQVVGGSLVVFLAIPALVLPRFPIDSRDVWVVRLAFMVLGLMVLGYFLAWFHLFSGVALLVFMGLTAWLVHRRKASRFELGSGSQASASFYDWLAGAFRKRGVARPFQTDGRAFARAWRASPLNVVWAALVLGVLLVSGWMRFDANWHHAALFFSDAYETVAWVKGIQVGTLFPNGLYPMGYYILMAVLDALTHANVIVFIKFFGAFVGTLLTGSVMWSTYRFSGRIVPALVAGTIYGLLPHLLPYDAVRQLAAEGQELGNIMVLPIAWLVFWAWVTKKSGYVLGSAALLAVVGLTHPVALLNAALAAVAATFGAWMVTGISGPIFRMYTGAIGAAALISIAPLGIGYLMGLRLMSGAATFLNENASSIPSAGLSALPAIPVMVWVSLGAIGALFIVKLLWYDDLWEMGLPATALLLLIFSEGIVQLPRLGIHSAVFASRGGEFVALVETFSIGLGVAAIQETGERLGMKRTLAALSSLAVATFCLGFLLKRVPPKPFMSYSMNSDVFVAEMVRIDQEYPRLSWLAVANGAYALAVNQGYQYNPGFWVRHVSPRSSWPKYHGTGHKSFAVSQRYIFLFDPTHISLSSSVPFRSAYLSQDRQQQKLLSDWIRAWTAIHGPMPIFFKNRQLTVYRLTNRKNPL